MDNITCKLTGQMSSSKLLYKIRRYLRLPPIYFLNLIDVSDNTAIAGVISDFPNSTLLCVSEHKFSQDTDDLDTPPVIQDSSRVDPLMAKRKELGKHVVSALYSNTRGLSPEKVQALQLECVSDTYILGNEWNKTSEDTPLLADFFGKFALIESCHTFTYRNGERIPLGRKKQGYGTGIVAKDNNILKKYDQLRTSNDLSFEIVAASLLLHNDVTIGCICVYRSPSMIAEDEIRQFYEQIGRYIRHMKSNSSLSAILYVGDPNTVSSALAATLELQIMQKYMLTDLVKNMNTRVGPNGIETQPDSCFAWFNCTNISISATVIGRICDRMDHRAIAYTI